MQSHMQSALHDTDVANQTNYSYTGNIRIIYHGKLTTAPNNPTSVSDSPENSSGYNNNHFNNPFHTTIWVGPHQKRS